MVHTTCFVSLAVANAKAAGKAMLLHTYLLSTAAIKLQLGAYAVDTERAMKKELGHDAEDFDGRQPLHGSLRG